MKVLLKGLTIKVVSCGHKIKFDTWKSYINMHKLDKLVGHKIKHKSTISYDKMHRLIM